VHRSWFIRREVLASAGVLAVAAGVAGVVRMTRQPPDPPAWRASQGPGAPGASGRAPSPADNLTIEPAGTPPPGTMPRAAVNVPAEPPARVVRETPPSPRAAREDNAGDKKTPPHPAVRKKPAIASEAAAPGAEKKPAATEPPHDVTPPTEPARPPNRPLMIQDIR
jgi:hypothetical protein